MVSIVIRAKNEADGLEKLFPALKEQTFQDFEIVLVDNGSTDETLNLSKSFGVKVIDYGDQKFSYGRALNLGFNASQGDFVVSIPGHCLPIGKNWLQNLIKPFSNPKVAAVYGAQKSWPGTTFLERLERFGLSNIPFNRFYPFLVNTHSAIRRKVWEEVHFNEAIPADEDHLWAMAVVEKGYKIKLVKNAQIWHSHHGSWLEFLKRYTRETKTYIKIVKGDFN